MSQQTESNEHFYDLGARVGHLLLILSVNEKHGRYDESLKEEIDEFVVDVADIDGDDRADDVVISRLANLLEQDMDNVLGRLHVAPGPEGSDEYILMPFTFDDARKAAEWVPFPEMPFLWCPPSWDD